MHIHIHQIGGHFQAQNAPREFALHQRALVGVFHGGHHGAVFYIPPVDIKILCAAAGTAGARRRDQPVYAVSPDCVLGFHQITRKIAAQCRIGGAAQHPIAGGDKLLLALADKPKRNFRMRKRRVQHHIGHKCALAHILFQKFHAGRRVVKQIVHRNGGAHRARADLQPKLLAAFYAVHTGKLVLFGAGKHLYAGHAGNAGQCLAAKSQRVNAVKILLGLDLAGGMAHKGVGYVFRLDAAAVIGDLNLLNAAARDGDRDLAGARVDRVFQQFLRRAGRALHHFACRDQFGRMLVQYPDHSHIPGPLSLQCLHPIRGRAIFSVQTKSSVLPAA